jgi:hypothetical protein
MFYFVTSTIGKEKQPVNLVNVSTFGRAVEKEGTFSIAFRFVDGAIGAWIYNSKEDRDTEYLRLLDITRRVSAAHALKADLLRSTVKETGFF